MSPVPVQTFTLNTGTKIPAIGFGTWQITPNAAAEQTVQAALEAGYRLIDTAKIYGNETGVGAAIKTSGLPRQDIFVTTKLWNADQGYDKTMRGFQESLDKLGLDYLDLYLIHWPATSRRADSWRALEELHASGRIKAAGVSNYTVDHLRELQATSRLVPAVNQVEFHPFIYEQQTELLNYCAQQGIRIEAYSPLSRLAGAAVPELIQQIAAAHKVSPQQIVLRWCYQHGTIPLPRSRSLSHIRHNLNIFHFELSSEDMTLLNHLSDGERVTWDPANMG